MTINGVRFTRLGAQPGERDLWEAQDNTYCPACGEIMHRNGTKVVDLLSLPIGRYIEPYWWYRIDKHRYICGQPDCIQMILLNPLAYGV